MNLENINDKILNIERNKIKDIKTKKLNSTLTK